MGEKKQPIFTKLVVDTTDKAFNSLSGGEMYLLVFLNHKARKVFEKKVLDIPLVKR